MDMASESVGLLGEAALCCKVSYSAAVVGCG
jgi:hypothetical protein